MLALLSLAGPLALCGCKGMTRRSSGGDAAAATSASTSAGAPAASVVPGRPTGATIEELALGGGGSFACARYSNGQVACAGQNEQAQLGRGTQAPWTNGKPVYEPPARLGNLASVTNLAVGGQWTCAVVQDGHVSCWGQGAAVTDPQVWFGDTKPHVAPNLTDAVSVTAGARAACVIKKNGTVACWGGNQEGLLGDGTTTDRAEPAVIKGIAGAKQLAFGDVHVCALTTDRTVVCTGRFSKPNGVAAPVAGLANVDEIVAGSIGLCARTGANVSCLGDDVGSSKPMLVKQLTGATRLFAAWMTYCALKADGKLTCVEFSESGPSKPVTTQIDARFVAFSSGGECVVTKDDKVRCNKTVSARTVIEQL